MKALAKVGLVEIEGGAGEARKPSGPVDDAAVERILAEPDSDGRASSGGAAAGGEHSAPLADATAERDAAAAISSGALTEEGRSLHDIYAEAKVPESAFPAEKLLRLLDGLRAMEPAMRKAAVLAMDAADEAWTIDDAILDAQRKVAALERADRGVQQALAQAEQQAATDLKTQEEYRESASASIRKQIAELEALLADELQKVASEKAAIQGRLELQRGSAARERTRLAEEAARLTAIPSSFASPEASSGEGAVPRRSE